MLEMEKYCYACGSLMKTTEGKFGKFRGCTNYPKCKHNDDYFENGEMIDNYWVVDEIEKNKIEKRGRKKKK